MPANLLMITMTLNFSFKTLSLYDLSTTLKNEDHVSCLWSFASSLFSKFFQFLKLRIFLSLRAFTLGVSYTRRFVPCFTRYFALLSPRAYIGTRSEARNFSSPRDYNIRNLSIQKQRKMPKFLLLSHLSGGMDCVTAL